MSTSDDERRALDSLEQFEPRKTLGAATLDRVGGRVRKGPRWARVFDRLGLADPYDYDAEEEPIGLGPVGVKLADRRRPAPHARPPGDSADEARPRPVQAPGRPAPVRIAEAPKPARPHPPPSPPPRPSPPVEVPSPAAVPAAEVNREPPAPLPLPQKDKKSSGRLRMGPRARATGPRIRTVAPELTSPGEDSMPRTEPEEPEVNRKPPGPDLGLDDLFGFAQSGGRFKGSGSKGSGGESGEK